MAMMPAQILQCAFAQQTGMPLARLGKFDDALGDDSVRKIVCKAEGRAGHFKCEVQNLLGFGIDIEAGGALSGRHRTAQGRVMTHGAPSQCDPAPVQNDSGPPQGPAGASGAS